MGPKAGRRHHDLVVLTPVTVQQEKAFLAGESLMTGAFKFVRAVGLLAKKKRM